MIELIGLANLLTFKTMQDKIAWTTEVDGGLHTIQGENYIEVRRDKFEVPNIIYLTIRNKDGFVLAQETFEPGADGYSALDRLIVTALRRSLRVDEALSDLQTRLEAL